MVGGRYRSRHDGRVSDDINTSVALILSTGKFEERWRVSAVSM